MSFTRFIRSAALIAVTLISTSLAQGAFAQGAFAQAPQPGGPGPIFDGPVVYPECKPPNKVLLATPQVFTCAWAVELPDDFEQGKDLLPPLITTPAACAPNAYWQQGPSYTGSSMTPGMWWPEFSCFHKSR